MHRVLADGPVGKYFAGNRSKWWLDSTHFVVWEMRPQARIVRLQDCQLYLGFPYTQAVQVKVQGYDPRFFITCSGIPMQSLSDAVAALPIPWGGPAMCVHPIPANIEEFISLFWRSEFGPTIYGAPANLELLGLSCLSPFADWQRRTKNDPKSILNLPWQKITDESYSPLRHVNNVLMRETGDHNLRLKEI